MDFGQGGSGGGATQAVAAPGDPVPDGRTGGDERAEPLGSGRRGIAYRLLALILLFSSMVTLFSTGIQLYLDYRRDLGAIEARLGEIEASLLGSLSTSLWNMDADHLRVALEGLRRLPDIRAAEVRETLPGIARPLVVAAGTSGTATLIRRFPLRHANGGELREIGVLTVEISLDGVYARLIDRGAVILVTQGIKTFLVSLFILYIVYRLVTRHLRDLAGYLARYRLLTPAPPLCLDRRGGQGDELELVAAAVNALRAGLEQAYAELRQTNAELARDIVARERAEAEVTRLNAALEARVRQRTAELEAANRELAAFSHSVSHDLRAPLRRIEGFGRMLAEDYGAVLDERGRHYLERIRAGSQDMAAMIDSFLKLSRATCGELEVGPVDLSALAAEIIATLREKEPGRAVTVEIPPVLLVQGDRRLLAAALTNLLDNAWKYTRRSDSPCITLAVEDQDGRPVYRVRDNGAGFDMALADRLFAPFNRLHRAEDFEGTGIGLATVQRIIARHGGRVWGEGAPGQGAAFRFTLWEGSEG